MAATDYARGRAIAVNPVPVEIIYFILAKEFGWLPSQVENESTKKINGIMQVLSIYNKVQNQEIKKSMKK
jgi:hypothetical protein